MELISPHYMSRVLLLCPFYRWYKEDTAVVKLAIGGDDTACRCSDPTVLSLTVTQMHSRS